MDRAHKDGANIIILSDRDIDENHVPVPSLLAVSALQQYLVRTKKRTGVALILESGEPREVHHFATLLGYGACAVNPYLAHESIRSLIASGMLDKDYYAAVCDYDPVSYTHLDVYKRQIRRVYYDQQNINGCKSIRIALKTSRSSFTDSYEVQERHHN